MTEPRIVTIASGRFWFVHVHVGQDILHFPAGPKGYQKPIEARRLIDHLRSNARAFGWTKALELGELDPPPTVSRET